MIRQLNKSMSYFISPLFFLSLLCLYMLTSSILEFHFLLYMFSDNFKKSFMKACMCTRGKDINAQLQIENSIFPRFGRSNRSSEKLSAIAKSNFQKTKTTIAGKESEGAVTALATSAAIVEQDKSKNLCIKTTAITIPNHFDSKNHNMNGINETASNVHAVQRTEPVLHTDL